MHYHGVAITVGNDAGQAIRFGMNQAQAFLPGEFGQGLTAGHGGSYATFEKPVIDALAQIKGPHPGADLRVRAVGGARQWFAATADHFHRIAGPGSAV